MPCLFLGTAEALAKQATQENFDKGMIYPPFSNIRKISAHIAANVAAKAYELGEFLFTEFTGSEILHTHPWNSIYEMISICRFGYSSPSAGKSGGVCWELHVQPCISIVPVNGWEDPVVLAWSLIFMFFLFNHLHPIFSFLLPPIPFYLLLSYVLLGSSSSLSLAWKMLTCENL